MIIRIDGNVIKCSRITGPTHHFAALEFSRIPVDPEFRFIASGESVPNGRWLDSAREALKAEEPIHPVNGNMHVKTVFLHENDTPNILAHQEIFRKIFLEAENIFVKKSI